MGHPRWMRHSLALFAGKSGNMLGIGEKHELTNVFLIDDDLISREVIATVLTCTDTWCIRARTGDGALEMLAARTVTPGVVLMDAQLPGLRGQS